MASCIISTKQQLKIKILKGFLKSLIIESGRSINEKYKGGLTTIFMPHSRSHFAGLGVWGTVPNKTQHFLKNGSFFATERLNIFYRLFDKLKPG